MGTNDSILVLRLPAEMKSSLELEAKGLGVSTSELIRVKLLAASEKARPEPVLRVGQQTLRLEDIFRPEVISYDYVRQSGAGASSLAPEPGSDEGGRMGPMSEIVQEIIRLSREEALRLGHDWIGTEHLLLGIIAAGQGNALVALGQLVDDLDLIRAATEEALADKPRRKVSRSMNVPLTKQAESALKLMGLEGKRFKSKAIGSESLLLAILRDDDNLASQILAEFGVVYDAVMPVLNELRM